MSGVTVHAELVGAVQVLDWVRAEGRGRREKVVRTTKSLGIQLSNNVKRTKLTGQVLNVRTGRLRSSINARFEDAGDEVSSTVGTAVPYGRFWELGFVGVVTVRAHVREIKSRSVMLWGEPRRRTRADALDAVDHSVNAVGVAFVRSHQRRISEPARPFLQPALHEIRDKAIADLLRAIGGG